jgi:hypothetical protein
MRKLLLSFSFILAVAVCFGQEKIVAFGHIGKEKRELQALNHRMVFSFDGGYVRPRWKPGTFGTCETVEVTFYGERPKWEAEILPMLDAPAGELQFKGETKVNRGDVLYYTLTTPEKEYSIMCIGDKGNFIELVVIRPI